MLDEARYNEATGTAAFLAQMERQVNAQIEARVAEAHLAGQLSVEERVRELVKPALEDFLADKIDSTELAQRHVTYNASTHARPLSLLLLLVIRRGSFVRGATSAPCR